MINNDNFDPDWASAPGETIADILDERCITRDELAQQIGVSSAFTEELLRGQQQLTSETARKLKAIVGGSSEFWLARESQYRDSLRRRAGKSAQPTNTDWLGQLPLKDMIRFGWVKSLPNKSDQLVECLKYFNVSSPQEWEHKYSTSLVSSAFRKSPSFQSSFSSVVTWLRQGEIVANSIACARWSATRFEALLESLRPLTREKDPEVFLPELQSKCAMCGVAVAVVRTPSGCPASGAARFTKSTALLMLSFRYLSDDHFWFTFFHEAGHLVLHRDTELFLEGFADASTTVEAEANQFAARVLIPPSLEPELKELGIDGRAVIRFARKAGVSPGIIVGQLQHRGLLTHRQLNNLKRRFSWD